ncbi:hypothetical protein DJ52_02690 [Brachyspira murdochii]|uniref:Uncharacterized protein n=1 Tax=Brachyspira murdochii TaxID=84378 RepID=A0ABX5B832_9SPIR|nr:hypothetical protein DJ52_02690 [Brachyspira murdochii]
MNNIKIQVYKSKIFAYLETIKNTINIIYKEENKNYIDKDTLYIENIYLNELITFLYNEIKMIKNNH